MLKTNKCHGNTYRTEHRGCYGGILMSRTGRLLILANLALLLSACAGLSPTGHSTCTSTSPCSNQTRMDGSPVNNAAQTPRQIEVVEVAPQPPIIVNATGYSAPVTSKSLSKAQARLMSLRGSKLDAYRNLSERVYGLKLDGSSSLSNMMAQHDELRAYIDAYLVGAKVISQRELEDGTFETIVEMALRENFRQCVNSPESLRSNPTCQLRPNYRITSEKTSQPTNFYSVQ